MVPNRSMKTTNLMLKQQKPHISLSQTSSAKLWIVELIHLLLWESRTLHVSGAAVLAYASGINLYDMVGKYLVISVVRNRSSPRDKRFFLCKVSTTQSLYSWITASEMRRGLPLSAVRKRYMEKLNELASFCRVCGDLLTIQANR